MRIAVIDLGSNTFHLVIFDIGNYSYKDLPANKLEQMEITRKRIYVRLGEGSLGLSYITEEAQKRALDAMLEFKRMLNEYNVKRVYAAATSAMRSASNGKEVIQLLENTSNIPVNIISGPKEAALIYKGVKEAVNIGKERALIMDIGGGSVEFIICDAYKSIWEQSFEIGAQRLIDKFHQKDPILPDDLIRLDAYLEENLQPLFKAVNTYVPTRLIGSSGAFSTLNIIYSHKEKFTLDEQATSYNLPFDGFNQIYTEIRYTTHAQRLAIAGLSNQRVDMIVISAALIKFILNKTDISNITYSKYSLKAGLLLDALEGIYNKGL